MRKGLDRKAHSTISLASATALPANIGRIIVAEPVIRCEDVHVRLGSGASEVHVLKGISLAVAAGESLSLTGPSGSGKSTLLMAIAGLERPHSASV